MASFDSTFDGQHGIATTMGATTKPRRTTTATKITRSGISLGAEQKVQLIGELKYLLKSGAGRQCGLG
jgi:hypothetical protein